jgi:DNA polymerase I
LTDKWIAFDVETHGDQPLYALQPWRAVTGEARITMFATALTVGDEVVTRGYLHPTIQKLAAFLRYAIANDLRIVCWNTAFDAGWLVTLGLGDLVLKAKWLDGMLIARHLINQPSFLPGASKRSFGLKAMVNEFLPEQAGYDDGIEFEDQSPEALTKRLAYNEMDSFCTLTLAKQFWAQLTPAQQRAVRIEAECLPLVAMANACGLEVDVTAAQELSDKLEQVAAEQLAALQAQCPEVTPEILASPKQLSVLLYETWGLTAPKQTEKGADSTDKEALATLADTDDRAHMLHLYREAVNNRTKFAEGALASAAYNGDDRTYPSARVFGTYTSRMTYSSKQGRGVKQVDTGIALHQWKRAPDYRAIITAPPGHKLMEFDAAGQEFRWMAVFSKDEQMIAMCQPGEDAHSFMASQIVGKDYHEFMEELHAKMPGLKDERQLGKLGNLSNLYRISANTLRRKAKVEHGVILSEDQSVHISRTFKRSYLGVPRYWDKQIWKTKNSGFVETIGGRRVIVPTAFFDYRSEWKWAAESTAINYPIQGSGGEQKYLALAVLKDYLPQVEGRFYFELHDGLYFIVPDRYADKALHEMRDLLDNLPYRKAWGVDLPVPFPWDAKIGTTWGNLQEVKHD